MYARQVVAGSLVEFAMIDEEGQGRGTVLCQVEETEISDQHTAAVKPLAASEAVVESWLIEHSDDVGPILHLCASARLRCPSLGLNRNCHHVHMVESPPLRRRRRGLGCCGQALPGTLPL